MSKWQKALDLLRAYEPKALGRGAYEYDGLQCAISVVLPSAAKLAFSSDPITTVFQQRALPHSKTIEAILAEADAIGLRMTDLNSLQVVNDMICESPGHRYRKVLLWVTEQAERESCRE